MRSRPTALLLSLVLLCTAAAPTTAPLLRTQPVNRSVASFKNPADFSTPERAYAALARRLAEGRGDFRPLTDPELVARVDPDEFARPKTPTEAEARAILTTQILETHTFGQSHAAVTARLASGWIDVRYFRLTGDRWLNAGNDECVDLPAARRTILRNFSTRVPKPLRPKISDPAAHLLPFVDHLKQNAADPTPALLAALKSHKLTILGEVHHRPAYWAFAADLVKDPAFTKQVSTIFLELPMHAQDHVDKFLDAKEYDPAPIVAVLRDNLWMGWPDQPMRDFFKAVWEVNHSIHPGYRLRVVLVDMPRDWSAIRTKADLKAQAVDRDDLMAANLQNDFRARRGDPRNALFVVGFGHAAKNLPFAADPSIPVDTAGSRLARALGPDKVYTVIQHTPALSNTGAIFGRAALGLFDAAFAATDNRPALIPLKDSSLGRERFDADADLAKVSNGTYADAFDAYLFLAPLESESFSPLIPDFYTDEFVKELDRRHRLLFDKPLAQLLETDTPDPAAFVKWMSRDWGQPRKWTDRLGPVDAWKDGD